MRKSGLIVLIINAAIFIALEVAALTMLRHNGVLQNMWFSNIGMSISGSINGTLTNIGDYFSLKKTNEQLSDENHHLRLRVLQLEEELGTIADSLSDSTSAGGFRYIPTKIVKDCQTQQHKYFIFNKGEKDGVSVGDGVVSGHGIIAIIDAVSENYSQGRSFRNHEMNIGAKIGKDGSVGSLIWDGHSSNKAILKEIPHHLIFEEGDIIYSSGYSSIFPPDIPLGAIGESKIVNGATFEIDITLFEDFKTLSGLSIVKNLNKEEIQSLDYTN